MNNSEIIEIEKCKSEMIASLFKAIRDASGHPETIVHKDLTLGEMMDSLAQNGIRFTYDPKGVVGKTEAPITTTQVKEVRELTGCGVITAKKALVRSGGDVTKAVEIMRSGY